MPGILYHIGFAEIVYEKLEEFVKLNKIDFVSGNLIPDLALNKSESHYRQKTFIPGFLVPDIKRAKKELLTLNNPIKLGMYCHLYLDFNFIENFLIPLFIWDTENMKVISPQDGRIWETNTFFSKNGIYGTYTEHISLIINDDLISPNLINELPEILPQTGIDFFDKRRKKTWKSELNEYLADSKAYSGSIFEYSDLKAFIHETASKLISEFPY